MPATKKKSSEPATRKPTKKAVRKPSAKSSPKASPKPREQAVAEGALQLVNEAAALLRKGISTGADTSEKARLEAKAKAHSLLTKASSSLSDLLGGSTSLLRKAINKI
jgi:F0F1-type ATP synthase epsilon subunit